MQGPHEVPKKRQRAGWACYQGGARYVDGLQGVKGRVCPMERQVCHGDRGIRNSLTEGCVHYKVRAGAEGSDSLNPEFPTNTPDRVCEASSHKLQAAW